MPAYELLCIIKAFERPELVQAIKRGAESIIQRGGIIRSFENLGFNELPYRMKHNSQYHTHGNYILIKFDAPTRETTAIEGEFTNNLDLIRTSIAPLREEKKPECECVERGHFIKHAINYLKPMSVNNKRQLYRDYTIRL